MSFDKTRLSGLLAKTGALKFGKFTLASGKTSNHYFDLRLLNGHPEGINVVASMLYGMIRRHGARSIGGLAAGSIPISTAISQLSWLEHQKNGTNPLIGSFYVSKDGHTINGKIKSPVVIVDDVITSGRSALLAVDAVRKAGYDCACIMCVVFRGGTKDRKMIGESVPFEYVLSAERVLSS